MRVKWASRLALLHGHQGTKRTGSSADGDSGSDEQTDVAEDARDHSPILDGWGRRHLGQEESVCGVGDRKPVGRGICGTLRVGAGTTTRTQFVYEELRSGLQGRH